ncbi:hypothetical protein A5791_18525 [Mycobacterium sp. 852002-51163_SCH5372311]|nr:hypothetical protein A5791_18525 [Mycobacterium sp. 852002-51163_SCH5372311]
MVVTSAENDAGGRSLQIIPERVDSLAGEIGAATAQFGNALRGVDDEVRNLLGTGWQGTPGSQFHDAFVEWHNGASKVVSGMTELVEALRTAAQSFHNADQPR